MSSSTNSAAAPIAPSSGVASFDPFGPSTAHAPSSTLTPSFDPFGPSAMSHNAVAAAPPAPMASGFAMNTQPPAMGGNFSAFDALSGPPQGQGMGYGMGMNNMGMGMGMNAGGMARGAPPHMMNNMGMNNMGMGMGMQGAPRPMMGGNAAMNISSYMAPPQAAAGYGGRPTGVGSSSRDPFAGLGLPGK
ncbi:hypothetical protein PINS_up012033 [Pythium insidiosum]|nr:hypothetical protein PINS_up012033 [Pythium insidiosum]